MRNYYFSLETQRVEVLHLRRCLIAIRSRIENRDRVARTIKACTSLRMDGKSYRDDLMTALRGYQTRATVRGNLTEEMVSYLDMRICLPLRTLRPSDVWWYRQSILGRNFLSRGRTTSASFGFRSVYPPFVSSGSGVRTPMADNRDKHIRKCYRGWWERQFKVNVISFPPSRPAYYPWLLSRYIVTPKSTNSVIVDSASETVESGEWRAWELWNQILKPTWQSVPRVSAISTSFRLDPEWDRLLVARHLETEI